MHLAAQEDKVPVAEILVKYNSETDQQTKVCNLCGHGQIVWELVWCHVCVVCTMWREQ